MTKEKKQRSSLPRNLLLAGIAAAVAIFGFLFSGAPEIVRNALVGSDPPVEISGPVLTADVLDFPLEKAEGDTITLREFEGDVIMVTYWASWCHTCRQTNPTIQTLAGELSHRDDISILLMSLDNVQESATDFLESARFTIPNVFPGRALPMPLNSAAVPTTYVIDKNGQIVYRHSGYSNYSRPAFREWMEELADRG
ncbi:MAG: TlpA family protein disulfide reductase [Balneolia bacterium]|nr:TlpA family protein disulfide reductase [Balneolia bacterium]